MKDTDMDWKGFDDTSPCADPSYGPRDAPDNPDPRGDDWKGMDDGTPSSMPTAPNKEPV